MGDADPDTAVTEATRVFETMGTTVSLILGGRCAPGLVDEAIRQVIEIFETADARYSLYQSESELSRLSRGELTLPDASADLRQMYDLAIAWRTRTNGAFTPHPGDGTTDLSGVVKAWAIAEAGTALAACGFHSWCINAGGDVLTAGVTATKPWTVGIVDPAERTSLLASVRMSGALPAIATWPIEVLAVEKDGDLLATAGFSRSLAA